MGWAVVVWELPGSCLGAVWELSGAVWELSWSCVELSGSCLGAVWSCVGAGFGPLSGASYGGVWGLKWAQKVDLGAPLGPAMNGGWGPK